MFRAELYHVQRKMWTPNSCMAAFYKPANCLGLPEQKRGGTLATPHQFCQLSDQATFF